MKLHISRKTRIFDSSIRGTWKSIWPMLVKIDCEVIIAREKEAVASAEAISESVRRRIQNEKIPPITRIVKPSMSKYGNAKRREEAMPAKAYDLPVVNAC